MLKYIATTRFNNQTWDENQHYLKEKMPNKRTPIKCIYPVSHINTEYSTEAVFFVLEMNNDLDKIMGIGLVRNNPAYNKYKVYKNNTYNQYAYIGIHRIDRKDMDETEEVIMRVFDYYCFKGHSHLKRLKGIKIFPRKILVCCNPILNLPEFVAQMFRKRTTTYK